MEIRNMDNRLVCVLSEDKKVIEVRIRGYITYFWANADGTLNYRNEKVLQNQKLAK